MIENKATDDIVENQSHLPGWEEWSQQTTLKWGEEEDVQLHDCGTWL